MARSLPFLQSQQYVNSLASAFAPSGFTPFRIFRPHIAALPSCGILICGSNTAFFRDLDWLQELEVTRAPPLGLPHHRYPWQEEAPPRNARPSGRNDASAGINWPPHDGVHEFEVRLWLRILFSKVASLSVWRFLPQLLTSISTFNKTSSAHNSKIHCSYCTWFNKSSLVLHTFSATWSGRFHPCDSFPGRLVQAGWVKNCSVEACNCQRLRRKVVCGDNCNLKNQFTVCYYIFTQQSRNNLSEWIL